MTLQEQELKIELTKAIEAWIEKECDDDNWASTDIIAHSDIASDMADAAYAIFQAVHKNQAYCKKEGYLTPEV